jgi:hypothetical protein
VRTFVCPDWASVFSRVSIKEDLGVLHRRVIYDASASGAASAADGMKMRRAERDDLLHALWLITSEL